MFLHPSEPSSDSASGSSPSVTLRLPLLDGITTATCRFCFLTLTFDPKNLMAPEDFSWM